MRPVTLIGEERVCWDVTHAMVREKGPLLHPDHDQHEMGACGETHRVSDVLGVTEEPQLLQRCVRERIGAKQIDRKLSNPGPEVFSRNNSATLIGPSASINASNKKTQLEFVCFSDYLCKNIPSVTAPLWCRRSRVCGWFLSRNEHLILFSFQPKWVVKNEKSKENPKQIKEKKGKKATKPWRTPNRTKSC